MFLGAAASIKLIALLPAAGLVWWSWRRRGRSQALAAAGFGFGLPAVGYLLAGGLGTLGPLLASAGRRSRASVWGLVHRAPTRGGPVELSVARTAAIVVVALAAVLILAAGRSEHPAAALAAPLLAYLLLAPYVLPWYLIWVLPLVALMGPSARSTQVFLAAAGMTLFAYQYAPGDGGTVNRALRVAVLAAPVLELTGAAALGIDAVRRWRSVPKESAAHPSDVLTGQRTTCEACASRPLMSSRAPTGGAEP